MTQARENNVKIRAADARLPERFDLTLKGPLSIPEKFLDLKNFHYAWLGYDPQAPFKMNEQLRQGFIPCKQDEMEGFATDMLTQHNIANVNAFSVNNGHITYTGKDKVILYLCKIPLEQYRLIELAREREIVTSYESADAKLREAGGDYTSGQHQTN